MLGKVLNPSRSVLVDAFSVFEWARRHGRGGRRWEDRVLPARVGGRGRRITACRGPGPCGRIGRCRPAPPASATVVTPDGGDVPFYARISAIGHPDRIFEDGAWIAIVFYRPAECVPDQFDLLSFFDFPGVAFGPPTTDGFNVWQNGPGLDPAPMLAVTHGLGAVPVWFVRSGRNFESRARRRTAYE